MSLAIDIDELRPPRGWRVAGAARVAPLSDAEFGPLTRALARAARERMGGQTPNVFRVLLRSPRLFWPWLLFASRLMPGGRLDARHRECLILRVAWNCRSRYEWAQHVVIARRAGVTDADIARIAGGPEHPGWGAQEAALLTACDELHRDRFVTDSTWARLRTFYGGDDEKLIELLLLVGHYEMLAGVLNSAGTPLER